MEKNVVEDKAEQQQQKDQLIQEPCWALETQYSQRQNLFLSLPWKATSKNTLEFTLDAHGILEIV